jgi:hypothetical protein
LTLWIIAVTGFFPVPRRFSGPIPGAAFCRDNATARVFTAACRIPRTMSSCAAETSADVAPESSSSIVPIGGFPRTRTAIMWNRFIVRSDVPVNRAEPVSSGRTISLWETYVRQYLACCSVLVAAAAFAAGSSDGGFWPKCQKRFAFQRELTDTLSATRDKYQVSANAAAWRRSSPGSIRPPRKSRSAASAGTGAL